MALVQISDVVVPAVYNSYTAVDSPETTLFFQSGVAVTNQALLDAFAGGGRTATLPFWNDLDATAEPNISTDNPADVAVPDKVNAGSMTTRIADVNKWYSAANLTSELAGSDPMQRIRNRFGSWWTKQWQHRILACCSGLMAANIAQNGGDQVVDVSTQNGNAAIASNLMNGVAFTNALYSLGDQAANIVAVAVHSVVMAQMVKNDMIAYFKPSENEPAIPTFMGKAVIMDDSLPVIAGTTSGYRYVSILFGAGAIGYADGVPAKLPTEIYSEPLKGNGAGVESIGERKRWIIHPFGYSFTSASVASLSPTLAELRTAANWTRVLGRKLAPLTFLVTNG